MPSLIEELLDALLGPWGIAVGGVAVGIGLVTRRRAAPRSRSTLPDPRALAASGLAVGGWWRAVYAEARAEWEAEQSRPATARNQPGLGRVRDARGRFVRPSAGR